MPVLWPVVLQDGELLEAASAAYSELLKEKIMEEKENVDNTQKLSVVEWFTGYGGNELGLKRVLPNMQPVAFCEREAFVVANLVSKMEAGLMDPVPVWSDVTTFPIEPFKDRVGLFIASYPCRPFSHAGKRDGKDDERHLWPSCRRFICGAHPAMVFLENVEGHVTLGLSTVLSDLEEDGYAAAWGIFSASEVGAPHQRKRVFILAVDKSVGHAKLSGLERRAGARNGGAEVVAEGCEDELPLRNSIGCPHGEPQEQPAEAGVNAQRDSAASGGEDVAHQQREGLPGLLRSRNMELQGETEPLRPVREVCVSAGSVWPSRPGERQYAWEPPRVVGNPGLQRQEVGQLQAAGIKQSDKEGVVGNSTQLHSAGSGDKSGGGGQGGAEISQSRNAVGNEGGGQLPRRN